MVDVSGTATTKKVSLANIVNLANVGNLRAANNLSDLQSDGAARTNLGLGTAAVLATGIANTNVPKFTSGVADDDFLRVAGTDIEGRSATEVKSDLGLGTAAVANTGQLNGNVVVLDAVGLPAVDGSQLTGISSAVTASDLRGTTNPHIGAFPNQSFLVTDNPSKSVMVIADSGGNIKFLVNSDSAKLFLNRPSSIEEITTGVSVKEDGTEPDIEITTTAGTFSLVSGDSDLVGQNGLPRQQGFNIPDIGANPAPLLISGGTIA
jgi:hypothetical protein